MNKLTLPTIFLLLLISFSTVHGLDQQKLTVSNYGTIANQVSDARTPETRFNGVWTWKKYVNTDMLREMVSHNIFNIFMYVGYPVPDFDARLSGIVPETNYPISVTPATVQQYVNLLKSVDSRFKLWAWFGTYSTLSDDDSTSHDLAKVDLSTRYNRQVIIENMVEVASWGFYGVQEDTENIIADSSGDKRQRQIDFWNELQIALNPTGIKLAVFSRAAYPSLWDKNPPYEFIKQLDVDYIILVGDVIDPEPEVEAEYGSAIDIWKREIEAGLNAAQGPCLINTPTHGIGLETLLTSCKEINATSHPNYVGNTIYSYKGESSITSREWIAWDSYLSNLEE